MCSSICGYFLCRVPSRRCALAVGQIRIGIPILPPFKVLAPRAIVEVPTSNWALLGLGGCEGAMTFSLRARARRCGRPFMLGRAMDSENLESCSLSLSVGFGNDPGQALRPRQGGELRRGTGRLS
jgi:hypothetical protein